MGNDDVKEALISRPAIFMEPSEEPKAVAEPLKRDLEVTVMAYMESNRVRRLSPLLLETRVYTLGRGQIREGAADVEPLRIILRPDESIEYARPDHAR